MIVSLFTWISLCCVPACCGMGPPLAAFAEVSRKELNAGEIGPLAPQWSPDGQWIACGLPKGAGIRLLRMEGGFSQELTSDAGSGFRFAWSPDSRQIAWRTPVVGKPGSFVIRSAAVDSRSVDSFSAAFSTGTWPIWECGENRTRWVADGLTGPWLACPGLLARQTPPITVSKGKHLWWGETQISEKWGSSPTLAPSGKCLLFDDGDRLAVRDVGADSSRILCPGLHGAWSPDGAWIAFQITQDHSHAAEDGRAHTADTLPHLHDDKTNHRIVESEIWCVRPDGTGRFQLTQTPGVVEMDPTWSPDGRQLLCREENTGKLLILQLSTP